MNVWQRIGLATVVVLAGCDLGRPPKPERGPKVPAEAKLEYWPKIGWVWELCLDAPDGSAFFTWSDDGDGGPFIRLRPLSCTTAEKDGRDFLRAVGSEQSVEFLFPAAPNRGQDLFGGACPQTLSLQDISEFKATLRTAAASGKLTPEAAESATGMIARLDGIRPEGLRLAGGEGSVDNWSVRCADSSRGIPEKSLESPEHLETGQ